MQKWCVAFLNKETWKLSLKSIVSDYLNLIIQSITMNQTHDKDIVGQIFRVFPVI